MAKNNNCKSHIARRTGALHSAAHLPCPRSDWVGVLASLPLGSGTTLVGRENRGIQYDGRCVGRQARRERGGPATVPMVPSRHEREENMT